MPTTRLAFVLIGKDSQDLVSLNSVSNHPFSKRPRPHQAKEFGHLFPDAPSMYAIYCHICLH